MLTSTIVRLRALEPGKLPNTTGHLGHAAFLHLIDTVAPGLARALHENKRRQPFTVSPLLVAEHARVNGRIVLREGEGCSIRFTILEPKLFQSFQSAFINATPSAEIRLQDVPLSVEEILTTPHSDGWTGYITFAELREQARLDRTIALRFYSPTALSLGDTDAGKQFQLLPIPWCVFDSLCRKWNAFSETPLFEPKALHAWVEANVWVSEYDVCTQILRFDRFTQKGFIGSVVYEIKSDDAEMVRTINALADFALYAGVGYKTTWGMGQVRRIVK